LLRQVAELVEDLLRLRTRTGCAVAIRDADIVRGPGESRRGRFEVLDGVREVAGLET
jgi:hypothetical protein